MDEIPASESSPEIHTPGPRTITKVGKREPWPWSQIAVLVIGIFFVIGIYGLGLCIHRMPLPFRTFETMSLSAGALVVGGLLTLIGIIPAVRLNSDVKTEFYSARAAYLCVVAGLVLFGIITIGAVLAQVVLLTRRY